MAHLPNQPNNTLTTISLLSPTLPVPTSIALPTFMTPIISFGSTSTRHVSFLNPPNITFPTTPHSSYFPPRSTHRSLPPHASTANILFNFRSLPLPTSPSVTFTIATSSIYI